MVRAAVLWVALATLAADVSPPFRGIRPRLIDQIKASRLAFQEVPVEIRYTAYSLRKGQSARGAVQIVVHYVLGRLLQ